MWGIPAGQADNRRLQGIFHAENRFANPEKYIR
jgi:hypothetical protein